ncbi:MAG: transposase [bacterium]|nr:transposase [bacterium]
MSQPIPKEFRNVTFRLLPGSREKAMQLARIAGACRFVWNEMLDQQEQIHTIAGMCAARTPSPTFFTLGKAFTQLRKVTPWLQTMPFAVVRYTLKHQADAWQRFFRGEAGRPKFRSRQGDAAFTIPQNVGISDGKLRIPTVGWMRLRRRGGNPWAGGEAKSVSVKRIGGKWYAVVCYAIPVQERPDNGAVVGVDMNAGQVTSSDGVMHRVPDTRRREARMKRYARKMARQQRGSRRREHTLARLAKTRRAIAMARRDWQHQTSRRLAGTAGTVVIEDLKTRAMTASAKGTVEDPGSNVRQKAGLNRVILATGWAGLRQMLGYKVARLVAVPAHYTSQTCAECGAVDARSRRAQAIFECVACGHADHADLNAARNIRRRGQAHLHGEGRSHQATPASRETDRRLAA